MDQSRKQKWPRDTQYGQTVVSTTVQEVLAEVAGETIEEPSDQWAV